MGFTTSFMASFNDEEQTVTIGTPETNAFCVSILLTSEQAVAIAKSILAHFEEKDKQCQPN